MKLVKRKTGRQIKIIQKGSAIINSLKLSIKRVYKKITGTILNHPERSFFSVLGILFLVILAGNIITRPPEQKTLSKVLSKEVNIFVLGSTPKLNLTAKIEKSGVVKIVAQSAGIVQAIYKTEGQDVFRGQSLFFISTNYQGGALPGITRQIAQKNYEFTTGNYDLQKDLINRRRDLANKVNAQAADLRDIGGQSLSDTNDLISLNDDILNTLNSQLKALEAVNLNGEGDAAILQIKQAKAGLLSGLLSLKSAARSSSYQSADDKPPADLANMQKDLAIKQLDLEEKALDLARDISKLNFASARIAESLLYPSSPIVGTVERVYVQIGQNVNPGTALATVTGRSKSATAIISVPKELVFRISRIEPGKFIIDGKSVDIVPRSVSSEPTDGNLYTIVYDIPNEYEPDVSNGSSLTAEIPLENTENNNQNQIPLDSIYQTQGDSYVFIATPGATGSWQATSRNVELGNVFGQYVEVKNGIIAGDKVILNRDIVSGETVVIKE